MLFVSSATRFLLTCTTIASTLTTTNTGVIPFVSGLLLHHRTTTRTTTTTTTTKTSPRLIAPTTSTTAKALRMASSSSDSNGQEQEQLFLFDFDGVVCDSCNECTVSALRTCQKLKDQYIDETLEYPPQWLFDKMREIRPAIEVGWQIPVLLSVFLQQQQKEEANQLSVDEIVANYQTLVDDWLQQHKLTESDMIDAFGTVRDEWIQDDLTSWLDINKFYPGVPEALEACPGQAVLVTTKQQRFAIALCRHAGVGPTALPDDRIYGLGQYKNKADVIVDKMTTGGFAPEDTFFFEDRWPTLVKCLKDERLKGVRLHLCAWGYVSKAELAMAEAEPRVQVLSGRDDFTKIVVPTTAQSSS